MADQPRMLHDQLMKVREPVETEASKEAAAALRAQFEMELNSLKQCTYKSFECSQLALDGFDYCLRHILQDKNAPFKQCAFTYSSGKRCYLPAPKDKKDEGCYSRYCKEHAFNTHLQSSKRGEHPPPPHTPEYLLQAVSHYICKPQARTFSLSSQSEETPNSPDDPESLITESYEPFTDVDANAVMVSRSAILDRCSESESDVEPTPLDSTWKDYHAETSDEDSVDSEQEDVLKHANVYSAEEITLIARDKLIRLHDLYVEQYTYLHHELKERRRQYLHALKREKETYCSITNQIHSISKEQRLYNKLKAYNSYHRKHGVDAICSKRSYERRAKLTEGLAPKAASFSKCIYTEGGVKCGERALPTARHCRKHILEDPNQILFRACGKMNGDIECTTPIETIFDNSMCRLHVDIPPIRCYSQIRKDSESDYDDSLEAKHLPQEEENKPDVKEWEAFNQNVKTDQHLLSIVEDVKMEIEETVLDEIDADSLQQMIKDEPVPCNLEEETILNRSMYKEPESEVFIGFPSEATKEAIGIKSCLSDILESKPFVKEDQGDCILESKPFVKENEGDSILENKPFTKEGEGVLEKEVLTNEPIPPTVDDLKTEKNQI